MDVVLRGAVSANHFDQTNSIERRIIKCVVLKFLAATGSGGMIFCDHMVDETSGT